MDKPTERKAGKRRDLTSMPVFKAILALAIPITLSNILITLYQITDAFWVGQLGKEAVAGVAISFPIFFLVNTAMIGLTTSGATLVAQYAGKKDHENVGLYASQTFALLAILGAIFSALGYFFAPQIVALFGAEESVSALASQYSSIVFLSLMPGVFYMGFSSILRGTGEVKLPMYIVLATVVLNFFLDPIFMLGLFGFPKMGIAGVAWATTLVQVVSAAAAIAWILKHNDILGITAKRLVPRISAAKRLAKLGVPSMAEFLSRSTGMLLITGIVSSFGTVAIASYGIGMRTGSLALIPSFGISLAVNTLVGQNLGAGKLENLKNTIHKGMIASFIFLIILGIILFALAGPLSSLFIYNDAEVVSEAALFTMFYAVSLCFFGPQIVIIAAYRGAGKAKTAMALSITYALLQVIISYAFAQLFGLMGIWLAFPVSNALALVLAYAYFRKNPIRKGVI